MQIIKSINTLHSKHESNNLSFDDLYKNYYIDIRNYVSKLCGSWHISEEITQEVFIKFYKNHSKISYKNVRGWLYKVAHNDTINYFKKNSKIFIELDEDIKDISNDPYNEIMQNKQRKTISQIFMKMPSNQSQALLLKDMYGYSYEEISIIMKISYKAVKSLIYRGRQNFIKYYNEVINNEL